MYIPNGSYLYNTEDKKLYSVTNMTKEIEGEIFTTHPDKWIPSEKPISDATFNLVKKAYPWGRAETLLSPSEYEDVKNFATGNTTRHLLEKVRQLFPDVDFSFDGNAEDPQNYNDRVYLFASSENNENNDEEIGTVGEWVVFEANNGTDRFIQAFTDALRNAGIID